MRVYLVQHGDAVPESVDEKKPLSQKGRRDVLRLAAACKAAGISAEEALHSGKRRAAESAELLAEALKIPAKAVAGMDPLDPVRVFAEEVGAWTEDKIVVGHLPFLERLAALLVAGREDPPVVSFQRGGMVCLERLERTWCVLWTALPNQPHMEP
jgi:phosphohistidine phosphatase